MSADLPLPERIEKIIREHEEELTAELRRATGHDDLTVTFDREQVLGWPVPKDPPPTIPPDYADSAE